MPTSLAEILSIVIPFASVVVVVLVLRLIGKFTGGGDAKTSAASGRRPSDPAPTKTWVVALNVVIVVIGAAVGIFATRSALDAVRTSRVKSDMRDSARQLLPNASDEDVRRFASALKATMGRLVTNPRFAERMRNSARGAGSQAEIDARGGDLSATLAARGVSRLPLERLDEWNRLRLLLSENETICSGLWQPPLDPTAIPKRLIALPDDDLRSFMQINYEATLAELEQRPERAGPQLAEQLVTMVESAREDRERLQRIFDQDRPSATDACFANRWVMNYARTLPPSERQDFLSALAREGAAQ